MIASFIKLSTFVSMAIETSSNQTIMSSDGVFEFYVSKSINLLIFDAMQQVRNERPDS